MTRAHRPHGVGERPEDQQALERQAQQEQRRRDRERLGEAGGPDLWMAKIKTYEYLKKLKQAFGERWEDYWE